MLFFEISILSVLRCIFCILQFFLSKHRLRLSLFQTTVFEELFLFPNAVRKYNVRRKEDTHMRAVVYRTYGSPDVLQLEEVAKPTPKDDEVLIHVYAASANAADWHFLSADIFLVRLNAGLLKPKNRILGADVAGRVETIGRNVTQFQPGDDVFGDLSTSGRSTFAEYVCAREDAVVVKPANLTFEEAAAVPLAAVTALQALRDKGQIQPGQKVLINGASGGVGTYAVQLAKAFGVEVTAVCSTRNVDLVRSLGADHVIDYTHVDFTTQGQRYDLILAANGYHPIFDYKRALTPTGRYVMTGGTMAQFGQAVLLGPLISMTGRNKMGNMLARPNHKDLVAVKELLEAGRVKPVIDRRYPLGEVPEAVRYMGEGHATGKVVITVEQNHNT
jgi:NADPH:quinone reductase-like Zn-dependent oxidoreductase